MTQNTTTSKMEYCNFCNYPKQDGKCDFCIKAEVDRKTEQKRVLEIEERALGGSYAHKRFKLDLYHAESTAAKEALLAMKAFDFQKDNFYIHGPLGSGKSHLAVAGARDRKVTPLVLKPMQMARGVRKAALKNAAEEELAIRRLIEAPIFVIDDLAAEKGSEYWLQTLYEIVDGRMMEERNGLIVTSNLSLGALNGKLADSRIVSRFAGMCKVLSLDGERDRRLDKKD